MAYDFQVLGWEDWAGDRHWGTPTNINDVQGTFSEFYDDETGDSHKHWVFIDPPPFTDWQEWYDLIGGIIDDHGFELAS